MAAQNFGGYGQQKAVGDFNCSRDITPGLHGQFIFISVLNTSKSVTAFLGNSLILIALYKESSLHPPSKLLLRSLSATDLYVRVIRKPLFVTYCMSIANKHWNMYRYASTLCFSAASIFCGVSLLTLSAISVHKLLALLLGLRYRQVVTLKQSYVIVLAIWVVRTVSSAIKLWNRVITLRYGVIVTSLCLAISSFD